MNKQISNVAVLGAGAWGTALAVSQVMASNNVCLYGRNSSLIQSIWQNHKNEAYLPGIALPHDLQVESDLAKAVQNADVILLAIPAQQVRSFLKTCQGMWDKDIPVVLCAKGIEQASGQFMSQVLQSELAGQKFAVLSGPSFAEEVASGHPTAVTVAAPELELATRLINILSGPRLRCYASDDVRGVETGGALKNVLAIASGIVNGAGLGNSAQAALITRGFVEIKLIAELWGARSETLMGLSGLGDLILTCSSSQSRNFTYGVALAKKVDLSTLKLAEGVATAKIVAEICQKQNIRAPLISAVSELLDNRLTVMQALEQLFSRPLKLED